MARFTDFYSDGEVRTIMEGILTHFPKIFEGFDINGFHFIVTKKKKSRKPIKLHRISYPVEAIINKPYFVEVFNTKWEKMDQKRKNLAVFKTMCAIPDGGFDITSKNYSKISKPEIEMYLLEYAASGCVPNWMDNPMAKDPLERTADDMKKDLPSIEAITAEDVGVKPSNTGKVPKMPVTPQVIASLHVGKKLASV